MKERAMNRQSRVLVWDFPTRIFHWLLALSFLGAMLTSESERYADVHHMLGYTILGLVAFRLVWGLVGTRHVRFGAFAYGPAKVMRYLASVAKGTPEHHTGHNPAGSWAIYAIIVLCLATGLSGWATYNDIGGHLLEKLHEGAANTLLAVVLLHIGGVITSSVLHGENLIRSMITGMKSGSPAEAIRSARPLFGIFLACGVVAYWTGII